MIKLESISTKARDWREGIMADNFKGDVEKCGMAQAAQMLLNALNIKPLFEKENSDGYAQMRNKLNSESGIVIANHPGNFDLLCILAALDRKDLKFMVSADVHKMWSNIFGEDVVVPALHMHETREEAGKVKREKNEKGNLSEDEIQKRQKIAHDNLLIFRSILDHVRKGGLFIYFPTGGDDSRRTEEFQFENSFQFLVKKMKPTDIIYSFNISLGEKEQDKRDQVLRVAGSFSDASTGGKINVSRFTEQLILKIDEEYSQASEWQGLSSGKKEEDSVTMTRHYLEKFKSFQEKVEGAKVTK